MAVGQNRNSSKGNSRHAGAVIPFNPAAPEDDTAPAGLIPADEDALTAELERFVPAAPEVAKIAHEMFDGELPEHVVRNLIAESEEVAHSTRKIMQEHMRIGGSFHQMMVHVINAQYALHGENRRVLDLARHKVYSYIERVHQRSRSTIKLYIRCYEKFIDNQAAVQILSVTDMSLLSSHKIGDDIVDQIIEARKENPDLTKAEVKKLIGALKRSARNLHERDEQLEVINTELSTTMHQLDMSQLEVKRLAEEVDRLSRVAATEQESLRLAQANLDSANHAVSATQRAISGLERDRTELRRQLAEIAAKPAKTIEKEVPAIPAGYASLEEAIRALSEQCSTLERQIAEKKAEQVQLEEEVSRQSAEAGNGRRVHAAIEDMIQQFGEFQNRYHSAQLLVSAEGKPARYAPLFSALTDLLGKMHGEVLAATKAA